MRIGLVAATLVWFVMPAAAQEDDQRMVVEVPPEIAAELRAEMRQHMDTLDDVMSALAAGDFTEAATIAELRMDFGHRMWERLEAQGMAEEQILELRERMREAGMQPGQGQGMGMGMGPGRFMPDEFRAMGQVFHEAAQEFAAVARGVGEPPSAEDYADVVGALQFVTSTCRSCHATWRLE